MSAADAPADHILKIVIIGDGLVGKSSLMGVYTEGVQAFEEERKRTIGVDFKVRARPSRASHEPPCSPFSAPAGQKAQGPRRRHGACASVGHSRAGAVPGDGHGLLPRHDGSSACL